MVKKFDELSKTLGIVYEEDGELLEGEVSSNGEVMIKNNTSTVIYSNKKEDEEIDYQKTREIYSKLAQAGLEGIDHIKQIMAVGGSNRDLEIMATLIKSLNETAKNLSDLHIQRKITEQKQGDININVEKAAFVGSQDELLKTIRNANKRK